MLRFLWWLIALPLGIVLIALSVANRAPVRLVLDPFLPEAPALAVTLPTYLIVLGAFAAGAIIGAVTMWISQGAHRGAARRWRRHEADQEAAVQSAANVARLSPPRRAA